MEIIGIKELKSKFTPVYDHLCDNKEYEDTCFMVVITLMGCMPQDVSVGELDRARKERIRLYNRLTEFENEIIRFKESQPEYIRGSIRP